MPLQTPDPCHVASPRHQEQSLMLLTLPAEQTLSALQTVYTASKQTQVRTLDLICSQIKKAGEGSRRVLVCWTEVRAMLPLEARELTLKS